MKKEQIHQLLNLFENACHPNNGVECRSARDIQEISGYIQLRNVYMVIEKA